MATEPFDTLTAARKLEAAGMQPQQAAAVANQLRAAATPDLGELAAKSDVVEMATRSDIADLRAEFYRALWLQGGAIVAATVALVKLIPGAGQ